ncbi:hypothetical protein Poli38472_007162 [Pythium oligandrum]|uniref:Uncharacterized protein n=1 Tax=Pythium oligandrum TaxID=41045 RepID=A0A8K1C9G3_PYTOL|nr:hypothetical protein Poli38472_007162 [Pythium oligandrum]|eukprot:TMW59017.1 hypothetical protein Poli38472_007162 [Pythium oligandrum]
MRAGAVLMEFGATDHQSTTTTATAPGMAIGLKDTNLRTSPTAVSASAHMSGGFDVDDGGTSRLLDTAASPAYKEEASATGKTKAASADLGFESTSYFRFSDFGATHRSDFFKEAGNNELLPPRAMSPSNQLTHNDDVDERSEPHGTVPPPHRSGAGRGLARPQTIHHTSVASRRKNSIEMFLSQSPSQALGGGFLKMALDDEPHAALPRQAHPQRSHGTVTTVAVAPTAEIEREAEYRRHQLAMSQSPPVDTEDEWSSTSSQEVSSTASTAYYGEPVHHAQSYQYSQQQQQQSGYYGGQTVSGGTGMMYRSTSSDSYASGMRSQVQHPQSSQWNAGNSSSSALYGMQQQTQAPMHHQGYQQSYPSGGMRTGGGRGFTRSQSQIISSSSMYGGPTRSASAGAMAMMESSPPQSPHPLQQSHHAHHQGGAMVGSHFGTKQCKFFLQGHCRMGNKCKFAHHSVYQQPQQSPHHVQAPPPMQQHSYGHPASAQPHQSMYADDMSTGYPPRSMQPSRSFRVNDHHVPASSPPSHMMVGSHSHPHHAPSTHLPGLHGIVAGADAMLKVEDVRNRVFAMSKDQNGCRLLQEQLDFYEERKELCDVIYGESVEHLAEMMVDPFGNYLFQKLLERAKPLQRLEIIRRVSGNLVAAALNLHGTRSVQKVVEVCATSAEVVELDSDGNELRRVNLPDLIVEALKDDAVRLCIDSNGNHVIQRALQFMKPEYNQFVFDAVCKECTTVGTHRHGCCVLQRCLDAANDTQKREVITQVEKQAMKLMQDPYGNYVVQYVLDSCTAEEAYGVIVKPLGNVFELSIQKFSSNVIEKCLEKAPPVVLTQYIDEITTCPKMQKMLQDQFANYVVQRALCVASEDQCLALVKAIRPHLVAMKNTSGGRRITARILKRFPHMDLNLDMGFEPPSHPLMQGTLPPPHGMMFRSASMPGSSSVGGMGNGAFNGGAFATGSGLGLGLHNAPGQM